MNGARLNIRLNADTKKLILEAAKLRNQSVTQFAVATLAEAAGKVVKEHSQTILSQRDRELFLRLLDAPPIPNRAILKAVRAYRRQPVTRSGP